MASPVGSQRFFKGWINGIEQLCLEEDHQMSVVACLLTFQPPILSTSNPLKQFIA